VGRPNGASGADYVLEKPPAEEREAIEGADARALELVPQMIEGDLQGAMQKLHTQDKPVEKKAEAPKPEPKKAEPKKAEAKKAEAKKAKKAETAPPPKEEKTGLLKGLLKGLTGSKK
jgi:outer membrane biosynthesis protein TonB